MSLHGNSEIQRLFCWVVNYDKKEKKKILKTDLDKWLNKKGWVKGGPATKFGLGKKWRG